MKLCNSVAVVAFLLSSSFSLQAQEVKNVDTMLQSNDMKGVERFCSAIQRSFESGQISEVDLRGAFTLFQELDPVSEGNLKDWAANSPKSYVARLALGTHYLWLGHKARGYKFISETSQDQINEMTRQFHKADAELQASMALTEKPFLSALYLLDLYNTVSQPALAKASLARANKALPGNALARRAYAVSLLPRWGGSYPELQAFIEETKMEGVPNNVTMQLEAIKYNDMGSALEQRGDHSGAREKFEQALRLGQSVGGRFSAEMLRQSRKSLCSGEQRSQSYCQ